MQGVVGLLAVEQLDISGDLRKSLSAAVAQIVEAARPQAVVLFGSYAEGRADPDSDLDLLVVARTNNRWRLAARLYLLWHSLRRELPGLPPADILVYTPRQFLGQLMVGFPAYQAARHGVILHGHLPEPGGQVAE